MYKLLGTFMLGLIGLLAVVFYPIAIILIGILITGKLVQMAIADFK